MRAPTRFETTKGARWRVRHRLGGRQTSRTFSTEAEAIEFAEQLEQHRIEKRTAHALRRRAQARSPQPSSRLPISPLVPFVEARGGIHQLVAQLDDSRSAVALERRYHRAQEAGYCSLQFADCLAVTLLFMHPMEIWGDEWLPKAGAQVPSQKNKQAV